MTPGQIVIVSGTSGSGKSTACELFVKQAESFWLLYGIDHFLSRTFPTNFGHHGPRGDEGIRAEPVDPADPDGPLRWRFGPDGLRAFGVMHEWIAAASRGGCNIILDHLAMLDPPLLQDMVRRLDGLPVLLVCLKPPYEVLCERVASRPMANISANPEDATRRRIVDRLDRLRPWFYEAVYANEIHDLVVDTARHDPDSVCKMIRDRLAQGPGDAFRRLKKA